MPRYERGSWVNPTLEESDRWWRELAGGDGPLWAAFERTIRERGFDPEHNLLRVAYAYRDAGRFADLAAVAEAVIAAGADILEYWLPLLVIALVELGRLDEADAHMRELVRLLIAHEEPDCMVAAMRICRARGDTAVEAMLFHAGGKWVGGFKSAIKSEIDKRDVARFGSKPADLVPQFLAWLDRYSGIMTADVARVASFEMWAGWLGAVGVKHTKRRADEITAEEAKREALLGQLAAARDEATARALVDQVAWFVTPQLAMSHDMRTLPARVPLATFALVKHAIANRALSRWGGFGEHALLVSLALSTPALTGELPAVYELARVVPTAHHEHHLDHARAAIRLGLREAAIGHVAKTLEYSARYWGVEKAPKAAKRLHAHAELASLRGDPAFEQLFVDDRARHAALVAAAAAKAARSRPRKRR